MNLKDKNIKGKLFGGAELDGNDRGVICTMREKLVENAGFDWKVIVLWDTVVGRLPYWLGRYT